MTDASQGAINLNGHDVGADTTINEMMEAFPKGKWIHSATNEAILYQMGLLKSKDSIFVGRFYFRNGKLFEVYLSPACVKYPSDDNCNIKRIQKNLCDEWLRTILGDPDVWNESETKYHRNWGDISVCSASNYDGFDGGSVIRITCNERSI